MVNSAHISPHWIHLSNYDFIVPVFVSHVKVLLLLTFTRGSHFEDQDTWSLVTWWKHILLKGNLELISKFGGESSVKNTYVTFPIVINQLEMATIWMMQAVVGVWGDEKEAPNWDSIFDFCCENTSLQFWILFNQSIGTCKLACDVEEIWFKSWIYWMDGMFLNDKSVRLIVCL